MATIRTFTDRRSNLLIALGAIVAGAFALGTLQLAGVAPRRAPVQPAGPSPAVAAYAGRWQGLAGQFAPELAYAARWQGLAPRYAPVMAYAGRSAGLVELPSRSTMAYGMRWEGLARSYAPEMAYAARWTGVAATFDLPDQ
jgi:hypothetical protein